MATESSELKNKAKQRIHYIEQDLVRNMIKQADTQAGKQQFEASLETLVKAYNLVSSTDKSDETINKHFIYSLKHIAHKFSLKSGRLVEKTIAIANFGNLNGDEVRESIQLHKQN